MWDLGQGVHVFLFGFPVNPVFCKTRAIPHVACVGKVCLCLAHQDSTRSATQCLVNVTCNSDLLMFLCVFVCFLGGHVCICVQMCRGQRASSVVLRSSGTVTPSFRDRVSDFYLEFTGLLLAPVLLCWLQVQATILHTCTHHTHVCTPTNDMEKPPDGWTHASFQL